MAIATVTSKGQVTIPKKVREHFHLQTGDKLDFQIEADGSLRVYPIARKVSEVFGAFAAKAINAQSTTDIKQRLRQAFKEGKI
jgi:AbrB family looped-hinge helix DNA binding protein